MPSAFRKGASYTVLVLVIVASVCTPLFAGEPQTGVEGQPILHALRDAVTAAKKGNTPGVRRAIRTAMKDGNYQLNPRTSAALLPEWLLAVQVAIDDVEGAKETARHSNSNEQSLVTYCKIADMQMQGFQVPSSAYTHFIEEDWTYCPDAERKPENSVSLAPLKPFALLQGDVMGARHTLREALPFARAITGDIRPLLHLGVTQWQFGDQVGALSTFGYGALHPVGIAFLTVFVLLIALVRFRKQWKGATRRFRWVGVIPTAKGQSIL